MKYITTISLLLCIASCQTAKIKKTEEKKVEEKAPIPVQQPFLLGIDNFLQNHVALVKNQRIGLLTNPSGVNSRLRYTSDLLFEHPEIDLRAFYGPEHGIRGDFFAGHKVADTRDSKTGLMIYSLYGERRKPTPEILHDIDIILIDIQEIGLRGYTYIYTMAKVMEAAAENNKKVMVLDRPNPLGGEKVEGNLVEADFYSFVGLYPIPYRYGMTIGELAYMFNKEYNIDCDLTVIPMQGWERSMYWVDTGLSWIPTSPHVPHWKTILYMGATGTFGELHSLSEGVGYTSPFELVGAPWINAEEFARNLNQLNLPGVYFRPLVFKPYYFTYADREIFGVQLHITDYNKFSPYATGLYIMQAAMNLYPEQDLFAKMNRVAMFNKVMGTDKIRQMLQQGIPVPEMIASWQDELQEFLKLREKYLIY